MHIFQEAVIPSLVSFKFDIFQIWHMRSVLLQALYNTIARFQIWYFIKSNLLHIFQQAVIPSLVSFQSVTYTLCASISFYTILLVYFKFDTSSNLTFCIYFKKLLYFSFNYVTYTLCASISFYTILLVYFKFDTS